jgi:hypothetical protein
VPITSDKHFVQLKTYTNTDLVSFFLDGISVSAQTAASPPNFCNVGPDAVLYPLLDAVLHHGIRVLTTPTAVLPRIKGELGRAWTHSSSNSKGSSGEGGEGQCGDGDGEGRGGGGGRELLKLPMSMHVVYPHARYSLYAGNWQPAADRAGVGRRSERGACSGERRHRQQQCTLGQAQVPRVYMHFFTQQVHVSARGNAGWAILSALS